MEDIRHPTCSTNHVTPTFLIHHQHFHSTNRLLYRVAIFYATRFSSRNVSRRHASGRLLLNSDRRLIYRTWQLSSQRIPSLMMGKLQHLTDQPRGIEPKLTTTAHLGNVLPCTAVDRHGLHDAPLSLHSSPGREPVEIGRDLWTGQVGDAHETDESDDVVVETGRLPHLHALERVLHLEAELEDG